MGETLSKYFSSKEHFMVRSRRVKTTMYGFKLHEVAQLLTGIFSLKNEPEQCVSGRQNAVQKKTASKEEQHSNQQAGADASQCLK